ncbi:DUF393 domain-containing protein [Kocuria atrinae]|uniref:thiol-disulfide oxidoreductase DCC family protein n=1 Tax=Kocuria atrinae TaxID=592377 RepID=UPI0031DFC192
MTGGQSTTNETQLDLIFDGRCGFCTRAVGWARKLDRHGCINTHAYQERGVLERFDLTESQADAAVWAVVGERQTAGAAAVADTLDAALGTRVFGRLYRIPPVRILQDRVYQWVADHRGKFPGVTPWCEQHPENCEPRTT